MASPLRQSRADAGVAIGGADAGAGVGVAIGVAGVGVGIGVGIAGTSASQVKFVQDRRIGVGVVPTQAQAAAVLLVKNVLQAFDPDTCGVRTLLNDLEAAENPIATHHNERIVTTLTAVVADIDTILDNINLMAGMCNNMDTTYLATIRQQADLARTAAAQAANSPQLQFLEQVPNVTK